MTSVYDYGAKALDGQDAPLSAFKGQALLIVNVASQCGFTYQFEGLEKLYRKYQGRGFAVLGFPCNQFGKQEPGDAEEIRNFCSTTYDVTFPMFAKIDVNGPNAHPLYKYLENEKRGLMGSKSIKWNFTKFLIGRDGSVLKRFPPTAKPEALEGDVAKAVG